MILNHSKEEIAILICNFSPSAGITRIRYKSVISARDLILDSGFLILEEKTVKAIYRKSKFENRKSKGHPCLNRWDKVNYF